MRQGHHDDLMDVVRIPTTRDIARACGVNQSTVSHALRNNPKISLRLRREIQSRAKAMGWRPNPLAAAYMAHLRSVHPPSYQATIGFLNTHSTIGQIQQLPGHIRRHFTGARKRAAELGYQLEPFWLNEPGMTFKRLASMLRNRGIPGLLVSSFTLPGFDLSAFDFRYFAAATLGYSLAQPALHRVGSNTSHGFQMMIKKAFALGYRKLAVIVTDEYDRLVDHGVLFPVEYEKSRLAQGHDLRTLILPTATEEAYPQIARFIKGYKPDVILGIARAAAALQYLGIRIPQQIAYISVDRAPDFPDIAGFNQRHETHGAMAVDLVVAQLLQNERGIPRTPKFLLVEGEWEDGLSAPPKDEIVTLSRSVEVI